MVASPPQRLVTAPRGTRAPAGQAPWQAERGRRPPTPSYGGLARRSVSEGGLPGENKRHGWSAKRRSSLGAGFDRRLASAPHATRYAWGPTPGAPLGAPSAPRSGRRRAKLGRNAPRERIALLDIVKRRISVGWAKAHANTAQPLLTIGRVRRAHAVRTIDRIDRVGTALR